MLEEGIIPFRDQPKFLNILGKMCRRLKSIPDSMHIGNCLDGPVDENCDGGFATVSRGEYQGHPVAIKKLRLYLTSDLEECFSVRHSRGVYGTFVHSSACRNFVEKRLPGGTYDTQTFYHLSV